MLPYPHWFTVAILTSPLRRLNLIVEASVNTAQQQSFEDGKLARAVLRMK